LLVHGSGAYAFIKPKHLKDELQKLAASWLPYRGVTEPPRRSHPSSGSTLRTINPIESVFSAARYRTVRTK
jgi:hypothetical protein